MFSLATKLPVGDSPKVYEYTLAKSGKHLQVVEMPPVFKTQVFNRGLESLTRRADGKEMWTANEEALTADGPQSTTSAGTVVPGASGRRWRQRSSRGRICLCD